MLEIVEMVGGNGAVGVEGLVAFGANEELHGYGGQGACHDEKKLKVLELSGGKPWRRNIGAGINSMELDVVEEMPQTNEQEAKTRSDMANQSAHDSNIVPRLYYEGSWWKVSFSEGGKFYREGGDGAERERGGGL